MIIETGIPFPKTNEQIIGERLRLHNLSATAKYHASHLHNSGCYDEKDIYHTDEAYKATIATVRYARQIN